MSDYDGKEDEWTEWDDEMEDIYSGCSCPSCRPDLYDDTLPDDDLDDDDEDEGEWET